MKYYKFVAIGDGGAGKTSLLNCYTQGTFDPLHIPTTFGNTDTSITLNNQSFFVALFDTAGQEEYDSVRHLSYSQTDLFLLCFSVVNDKSFENLKTVWIPEIRHHAPNTPFLVVGCKEDLRENSFGKEGVQSSEWYQQEAKNFGAIDYIECSSKAMSNISYVFELGLERVLSYQKDLAEMEQKHQERDGFCCVLS
eukprot:snap_masked-scaffold_1-processed-gene-1.28-mRNA-1 protein AED:0.32 eAED:0.32 QI:0/-1/0/1/-1/1/1/0/194